MRTALRSALAVTAVVLAGLTTACSASPTEPTAAPKASKTQPAEGHLNSGYVITWG